MTFGTYLRGETPVHRIPAGLKVLAVFAGGTLLFLVDGLAILGFAALGVAGLYVLARVPWRVALTQLRPVVVVLLLFCGVQWIIAGPAAAAVVGLRLLTLVLLATLVTLTTRTSAMMAVMDRALKPLARLGIRTDKISLAVSLTLRFIPLLTQIVYEVREAQRVRGLERSVVALAVPLLVRTLKMADQVAEAIDARSYGGS